MDTKLRGYSISITGLVVLGGNTSVADPNANFRDAFAGTSSNGNAMANALVKITFAYEGYANAFNMMNEVKVNLKEKEKVFVLNAFRIPSAQLRKALQWRC